MTTQRGDLIGNVSDITHPSSQLCLGVFRDKSAKSVRDKDVMFQPKIYICEDVLEEPLMSCEGDYSPGNDKTK